MTTHGKCNHREYHAWSRMKQNCTNVNASGYKSHGAKGIRICNEWENFIVFIEEMGFMPANCNAIIRLDNSLEFCKQNCKWAHIGRGRPRCLQAKKQKLGTKRKRVNKPKILCVTIEQDHYDFISRQALKKSSETGKQISVNDLIREGLEKQFPCPKLFDLFGKGK